MSDALDVAWNELLAVALVGTERRRTLPPTVRAAADLPAPPPPAGAPGAVEGEVLAAAALLGGGRRAGWVPPAAPPGLDAVTAPPAEDVREAPAAAVQVLELLLAGAVAVPGGPDALVGEWLARCARRGLRVPPALLAPVLDRASGRPALRDAAARAVGARGRWLAGLNPGWSWATVGEAGEAGGDRDGDGDGVLGDESRRAWETRARHVRLELLRRARAADPAAGRALVASTWTSEAAADRATFVQVLHDTGPDDGDEPFLEAALDDRSAGVRAAAAAALDALPRSRRAGRMAARALPLVRVEGAQRPRLAVDLPAEPDAAARRDGVRDQGGRPAGSQGWGRRAWWLVQLVTATPLDAWADHLALPPGALAQLPGAPDELLAGWAQAAVRQRDAAWAEALLPRRLDQPGLLAVLDPAAAERALTPLLREPAVDARRLVGLLAACPRPWSRHLSSLVVARLRAAGDRPGPLLPAAPTLAAALDPAVAPEVEAWLHGLGDGATGRRDGRRLHHALTLRATIAEELP